MKSPAFALGERSELESWIGVRHNYRPVFGGLAKERHDRLRLSLGAPCRRQPVSYPCLSAEACVVHVIPDHGTQDRSRVNAYCRGRRRDKASPTAVLCAEERAIRNLIVPASERINVGQMLMDPRLYGS